MKSSGVEGAGTPQGAVDHETAWGMRIVHPERLAALVDTLPTDPRTTVLQGRVAQYEERYDEAIALYAEAEQALTDDLWRARTMEMRGNTLRVLGLTEDARVALAEAWEVYDRVGDLVGRASVRQNSAILPFQTVPARHALLLEALELAERAGMQELIGVILLNIASTGVEAGMTPAEVTRLTRRADDCLDGLWPQMAHRARCQLVELCVESGDLDGARQAARLVPPIDDVGDASVRSHMASALGALDIAEGRFEEAAARYRRVLELGADSQSRPDMHRELARALHEAGRHEDAYRESVVAYDLMRELGASEAAATARALDSLHRTEMIRAERARETERADALESALEQLRVAARRLHETSIRDAVTGLHNRQYLLEQAERVVRSEGSDSDALQRILGEPPFEGRGPRPALDGETPPTSPTSPTSPASPTSGQGPDRPAADARTGPASTGADAAADAGADAGAGVRVERRATRGHVLRPGGAPTASAVRDSAQVALIDLDHFKIVNDTFGHDAGDSVLRIFAATLRAQLPSTDLVARFGGEEFVVVRPPAAAGAAAPSLALDLEHLRATMLAVPWYDAHQAPLPGVTMSVGVVSLDGRSLAEGLTRADELMYEAKRSGRDRVVIEPPHRAGAGEPLIGWDLAEQAVPAGGPQVPSGV